MTGNDRHDDTPITVRATLDGAYAHGAVAVGKTVPLVRYDSAGRRTVIGVAEVTGVTVNDDRTVDVTVDATALARDLVEKDMPKAAPEFSLGRPHMTTARASLDAVRAALIRARKAAHVVAGIPVKVDPLLPPDVIELRNGESDLAGTILYDHDDPKEND